MGRKPKKPEIEAPFFTPNPYLERAMERASARRAEAKRARGGDVIFLASAIPTQMVWDRRNVEIKARTEDPSGVAARAGAIADRGPVVFYQDDTYFDCPEGRLKVRLLSGSEGELIFYARADTKAVKESRYRIVPTSDPYGMINTMVERYGVLGQVRKKRTLFLFDNARIHLDEVEGLGNFVEIEVVLSDDETVEQGSATVALLMERLGIRKKDLIKISYLDMLGGRGAG